MDRRGERGDSRNLVRKDADSSATGPWTGLVWFVAAGAALVVVAYLFTKG